MRTIPHMALTHLLYLHGFRSSPQSTKARMVAEHVARQHPELAWWCPQLPPSPRQAMDALRAGIADWPRASMAVIGSSLGGFYATWIAEQTAWHDPSERFFFRAEYVDELRAMASSPDTPAARAATARMFAVLAKGDEVLDWREMLARYPQARVRLLEGSDHALSDFDQHIAEVFDFLLAPE